MGIRDKPTAPASPWQNGFAERLIGSIRRECVDYFIVVGEAHLRRILRAYADYYNGIRTHRSLAKDAPVRTENVIRRRCRFSEAKFPVPELEFPVPPKYFPVLLRREFSWKPLNLLTC
jgi:hypothetical protein